MPFYQTERRKSNAGNLSAASKPTSSDDSGSESGSTFSMGGLRKSSRVSGILTIIKADYDAVC